MKLAFYKAFPDGMLYQKAIAWLTRPGPFCHVELVFDQWDRRYLPGMEVMQRDAGGSLCFSASEQDGGTRFKEIDLTDGHWVLVDIPIDAARAMEWCMAHQHIDYDWWGLRGFVSGENDANPKDLWCSECAIKCCMDQLYLIGFPTNISPNALAIATQLLTAKGEVNEPPRVPPG